ncbi:peptide ABC transporter substrate-binding protein [Sporolactobacillus pectinivorans]|uniref:peptide ABC transporter substrate-binding protein n=1 Tax=Sporolactobacillus pectinivorans TaxID=1591408 RepID=UPI001EFE3090
MKKWLSKALLLGIAAILVLAFTGCTAKPDASSTGGKEVLKLNDGAEPTSLDPPMGYDEVSWDPLNNLMEGLTRLGKDNQPQPAIAQKWDVSPDGRTYTFHIRKNAKWDNGDDLTAGDFVYAWKQMLDPKQAAPAAFLAYLIAGGEAYNTGKGSANNVQVKAIGSKTLQVTLTSPQSYFISMVSNPAFFPIDQKVAEKNPKWYANASTFVGDGPFKLASWKHDSNMVFRKSSTYWDKNTVKLDEVDWAMVSDPNTEYQMYKTGQLDMASVPVDLSNQLFKQGKVHVAPQAGTYFFSMNVNMKPFNNINIRRAFAMAVDNSQITNYIVKQKNVPAYGFVSPGFKDPSGQDFRTHNGSLYSYDPSQAKKFLAQGLKEEGWKTLPPVTLTYNTSDNNKSIAEAIQAMYQKNLGINIKLANMEWNAYQSQQKAGKFQFSRGSFIADYGDPINFLENFQTGMPINSMKWSNKEYDSLITQAKNEKDDTKRYALMYQAEKLLFQQMPLFTTYFYNQTFLQNSKVHGLVFHPAAYIDLKWATKSN